jgi:hypothetical protein
VVVEPPGPGRGNWVGAASVVFSEGVYHLSYRLRSPGTSNRGYGLILAESTDGIEFETTVVLPKEAFGAESLERPALVRCPDGRWRIYISCATPESKHWWIDAIDASSPREFHPRDRYTVFPGDAATAYKDPFILVSDDQWLGWICRHPLTDPEATDRMATSFAVSDNGVDWVIKEDALRPEPGTWYERGARVACVLRAGDGWVAYFDGRATATDNAEEKTGVAVALSDSPGVLTPVDGEPFATSPWGSGSLRYLSVVELDDGRYRLFYEAAVQDGSHALFSQLCEVNR